MEFNSDFKYDLKVGKVKESELGDAFTGKTIEVKRDLKAGATGNVFVEYESRGKPSGISTSEADYWCFALRFVFLLIPTQRLKALCRPYLGGSRDKQGGDSNTSKGILLPVKELLN